jgi:hypothetical protein
VIGGAFSFAGNRFVHDEAARIEGRNIHVDIESLT